MPIYEYECQKCGRNLEALQTVSEPPLTTCPDCKGELKKLLSAPAFQFKGSGWYVTDYAGKGKGAGKESKEEGGTKEDGGKESGKKADSGGSKKADSSSKSASSDT